MAGPLNQNFFFLPPALAFTPPLASEEVRGTEGHGAYLSRASALLSLGVGQARGDGGRAQGRVRS